MPEVEDTAILTREEARSVHDIGDSFEHRTQQYGVICRVIFQIGVLNQGQVAGQMANARPNGSPLTHVFRMKNVANAPIRQGQLLDHLSAAVGRTVIDDNQFQFQFNGGVQDSVDDRPKCADLIINGHEHAEFAKSVSSLTVPRWDGVLLSHQVISRMEDSKFSQMEKLSVDGRLSVQDPEKVNVAVSSSFVDDGNTARALPEQFKAVRIAVLYQSTQIASQRHAIRAVVEGLCVLLRLDIGIVRFWPLGEDEG